LHLGHVNLFVAAKALGTDLGVIVNADEYVARKHPVLMPQFDRADIIRRLDCVSFTVINGRADGDVSDDLRQFRPAVFAVGPDYADVQNLNEFKTCRELGIEIVCMSQLTKDRSSSVILSEASKPKWVNPPVTCSVILERGGKVLLTRRAQEDGRGTLQLVGGFLEPGESLERCAFREVQEEIGVDVVFRDYLMSFTDTYPDGRAVTCAVFVGGFKGESRLSDEALELVWVDGIPDEPFFCGSDRLALEEYWQLKNEESSEWTVRSH
jgi:ADP-ribose pyrophosphatase YjhB (NUDIX family)/glycerol-3-phosphate cytidylyltransferase-like family protein